MSLYKRGRIWWCKWEIGGERVRESTYTPDRKAAQEFHDRRRAEIWRATKLGETRVATWDEAALAWVDEHARHKKSYETDRQRLLWLTKRLTGQPLTALNTEALLKLRKTLLKGRRPATANRYLALVSAVLHYAHAKSLIGSVPKIPYLPEARERFRWLTRDQARALIAELPKHLAAMTRFALATGLRRANVTGLTWDSFDTARRVAWIWPDEAKAGRPISVPLNDDALAILAQQRALPATWDKKGVRKKDPRHVFTYRGQPVCHTTTRAWEAAVKRAGIAPGFTFHDLRHTWASWHVMAGTPLPALQQLGGWASLDMVMQYAHLAPGYVAGYAGNASLDARGTNSATAENQSEEAKPREALQLVG